MRAKFGRLILCHMLGDTEDELHAMAQRIGVKRKWYQGDHYDVCQQMRARAVALGAKQITLRDAARMRIAKRKEAHE